VDARLTGERFLLVLPLIGDGTSEDPKRPMFTPAGNEASPIEAYSWTPTDDGRLAIVLLVVNHPDKLQSIIADQRVVAAFQKGKQNRAVVEQAIKKLKRDFSLADFLGGAR
jgi:hypothetical protein